jgi:hypothetical protein
MGGSAIMITIMILQQILILAVLSPAPAAPGDPAPSRVEVVRDGKAVAAIWCRGDGKEAAADLAMHLEGISGAKIEVNPGGEGRRPDEGVAAIVVGSLALELGLPSPPAIPSGDGYRILTKGAWVLLAGESPQSSFHASSHVLESIGCRWFFDNPLGVVIPSAKTVTIGPLDVSERPDFLSRNIWGPNWGGKEWKRHNRLGGLSLPTGHDWGHLPPSRHEADHPEYYALRGGKRVPGGWLCTSNPEVRRLFAAALSEDIRGKGTMGISISPPDGTGYCECEACRKEDVQTSIEPSSGRVSISDRYLRFFDAVAGAAGPANPKAILSFYAYADYSLPPREIRASSPNLCAWIAPIRFCRFHGLHDPRCRSRGICRDAIEGWKRAVPMVGLREYNYNLAEATVPFSKVTILKEDIPWLKAQGCIGLNIECLAFWHLYGIHTYLAARLAWDADADVRAILDDLYEKLFGRAAPHVRSYWERVDRAYREADVHAGSFYGLHAVWTPTVVESCRADLEAAEAASDGGLGRRRVAMFRAGLESVLRYLALRERIDRCDFAGAAEVYDAWIAHLDRLHAEGIHPVAEYKRGYVPRFLGPIVESGRQRTSGGRRLLLQLPDTWSFRYDPEDRGEGLGWGISESVGEGWRTVRTWSATLNEQGVDERFTWMWYRVSFPVPPDLPEGPVHLWFGEIDGRRCKVFVNGRLAGEIQGSRKPCEVEVTGMLVPGRENTVAVKIDHSRISELYLGGILRPVMLYLGPKPGDESPQRR